MHWRISHACIVCRIVLIGLGALGGVYALKRLSTKQHGHGTNLPHLSSSLQYSQHARICTIIRCCGGDKCRPLLRLHVSIEDKQSGKVLTALVCTQESPRVSCW